MNAPWFARLKNGVKDAFGVGLLETSVSDAVISTLIYQLTKPAGFLPG